jgi:SAM-dependent methyltransferase
MKIQQPPTQVTGSYTRILGIDDLEYVSNFIHYYNDKDFDERYYSQFEWFKGNVSGIESIANLGCGAGRETFALTWKLHPSESIGIDIDNKKIKSANEVVQFRNRFLTGIVPSVRDSHAVNFLQSWYEGLPIEIREGVLPQFVPGDITLPLNLPDNYFYLVYSRYTLWEISDSGSDNLSSVCHNISRILRPRLGRVVIVEPSANGSNDYDFERYFHIAGLELIRIEEEKNNLGWLEPYMHENEPQNPRGYVFAKL